MNLISNSLLYLIDQIDTLIKWIIYNVVLIFTPLAEKYISKETFEKSGGKIIMNGSRPWDIKVNNKKIYAKIAAYGSLGFAEAYLDGWWDCDQIDVVVFEACRSQFIEVLDKHYTNFLYNLKNKLFNYQTREKSTEVMDKHYDLGVDLFEECLDSTMAYSSGYWKTATDLEQAQIDNMELVGQKLMLKPGMRVLNIGMGYGGIDKYLCQKFGVSIVGYTLSKDMARVAQERCQGLDIKVILKDYRDITGTFDRIFCIEMLEHVGPKNYKTYFNIVNKCLVDDGIFLLQASIVNNKKYPQKNPMMDLVFVNSIAPRLEQIIEATNDLFIIEDLHNYGIDMTKTLSAFDQNFVKNWYKISTKYGEKFYRFWRFYLQFSAGVCRSRMTQLEQIVFTKKGLIGGYKSVR